MKILYIFFTLYYFTLFILTVSGSLEPSVFWQSLGMFLGALLFFHFAMESE